MNLVFNILLGLLVFTFVNAGQPNSLLDITPGVAQAKSFVQMVFGDIKGAKQTQKTYVQDGLGPSQARSLYHLVKGEPAKALELQKQFLTNAEGMVDSLPGVGHAKGLAHIVAGDNKHGWEAIKSATSSTGSVIGAVLGGPAGAVAGHVLTDAAISGVDLLINGNKSHAHGVIDYAANIGKWSVGEHVDAISGLLLDAAEGKCTSKSSAKSNSKSSSKSNSISSAKSIKNTAIQRSEPKIRDSEIVRLPLMTIDKAAVEHSGINERSSLKEHTARTENLDSEIVRQPQVTESGDSEIVRQPQLTESGDSEIVRQPQVTESGDSNIVRQPQLTESEDSEIVRQSQVTDETATEEKTVQTVPKGPQEARTGNLNRPTVEEQEYIRHEVDFAFKDNIEEVNAEKFKKFSQFLRNDPLYKDRELYRWKATSKFYQDNILYNMKKMADFSIPKLTYLTKAQQDLVGFDEFRFVNTLPDESKNCFGCAVAGAVKKDVKTLHTELNKFSKDAYSKDLGANPDKYLAECEEAALIEYETSPELMGLDKLNDYLKEIEPVHDNPDTKSILDMYDHDGVYEGHSYVVEYKFLENSPTPEMVLVDYQQIPYLYNNIPNPMRIINYVDTASYTTYKVHTIRTLPVEGIKNVDLITKTINKKQRVLTRGRNLRKEHMKDPAFAARQSKRFRIYNQKRKMAKKAAKNAKAFLGSQESGSSVPRVSLDASKATLTAPQDVLGASQPSLDAPKSPKAAKNSEASLGSQESGSSVPRVSLDASKATLTAPQDVLGASQPSLDAPKSPVI